MNLLEWHRYMEAGGLCWTAPASVAVGKAKFFGVVDTKGEHEGEYALKRVLNPARHDRFRQEVEAIKRVSHPNIIKLIDHSALSDESRDIQKQFIVMPIAAEGDLAKAGRGALYSGVIDGVLQVAKQLTAALAAAHAHGIIHRDVKPENVLFTGSGHETWLSDFGICLIRELPRYTDAGEVVGPRAFLAPELEDGGRLDVTPAADIYSLGKVLYYMISGGVILPRERLHEEQYSSTFRRGERHQLLYSLLQRMICRLEDRLQSMGEVMERLMKIASWEDEALLLPITPQGLAAVEVLRAQTQEAGRIAAENRLHRRQESERLKAVLSGFGNWLNAQLGLVAAHIADDAALSCAVLQMEISKGRYVQTTPTAGLR